MNYLNSNNNINCNKCDVGSKLNKDGLCEKIICAKGTRLNKDGLCEKIICQNGTRLNKDGLCVEDYETTDEDYSRYETDLITARDKFKKPEIKKLETQLLNRRDLYANLCPSVYNKKMLKLKHATPYMNALPGYTNIRTVEYARELPNPSEPIPYNYEDTF